jgi:hypothetical protein
MNGDDDDDDEYRSIDEGCSGKTTQREQRTNDLFTDDDKIYFTRERRCPLEMSMKHAYRSVSDVC